MLVQNYKILVTIILVSISGLASADDAAQFYVGAEVSILNKANYSNGSTADLNHFKTANSDTKLAIRKTKPGGNFFFGADFSESWGAELGFGLIQKVTGVGQPGQATNKITNLYADVLGYVPVATSIKLIGTVGLGSLKSKANVVGATFQNLSGLNKRKTSFRVGGGMQFDITNNWAARALARYQKGSKIFLKSNISASIGAAYTF